MEVTAHAPGTPSWADVSCPDVAAGAAFYRDLFGWTAIDMGEEAGHYTMFEQDGKAVAACGPKMPDDPGPPAWMTYVSVADADQTVAAITANGGTVLMEPMDIFTSGRMAVAADPSGGVFSIWQPGDHIGAQLVNEPNSLCWNELNAREPDTVLPFYSAIFGWTVTAAPGEDGTVAYRELQLDGRSVAGCMQMDDRWPAELPTHWLTYFAVADCDAIAARAGELGGAVRVPPTDIPIGRFAVLADPAGAFFSVIALNEPG